MSSSHLLQEAVLRAAHQHDQNLVRNSSKHDLISPVSPQKPNLNSSSPLHSAYSSANNSDNEDLVITRVHTPARFESPPSTPITQSRPPSPSPTAHLSPPVHSRPNSRVGLRAKREAAAKAKASSLDPLRRLPNQITVRIFELIGLAADGSGGSEGDIFSGVKDLMRCGLVCQKWRESATINFIWFKLWNSITYDSSLEVAFQPPTWARKDSKINWSTRYRNKNRVETVSPSQSVLPLPTGPQTMTANELRHQQWKEESESNDHGKFASKLEARAFYKELGGRKLKNKTGKSFGTDRTGWDDEGPHE